MKAVILAGGRGTRLGDETAAMPKPMVRVGGRPILWHIMRLYAHFGVTEFIVCLGYLGEVIEQYFAGHLVPDADGTAFRDADWRVTLADTGPDTETGGRIRRIAACLPPDEPFCMTYGDGLGDIDIAAAIAFHRSHGRLATVTAVRPPPRFGGLRLDGDRVASFSDAPLDGWINGGFFVLSPKVLDLIDGDATVFEQAPVQRLVAAGQLAAFRHDGFWQPMDTIREKHLLNRLWDEGAAPWKLWA
jgi:glucose-1-phosphate cytidylyltransferase